MCAAALVLARKCRKVRQAAFNDAPEGGAQVTPCATLKLLASTAASAPEVVGDACSKKQLGKLTAVLARGCATLSGLLATANNHAVVYVNQEAL